MMSVKIGVAISTRDRYEVFKRCYNEVKKHLPKDAVLVVLDDGSQTPVPEATHRNEESIGIARGKNMCLRLLYEQGVTDFFLLDNDIYPLSTEAFTRYVESPHVHLNYIFQEPRSKWKLNDMITLHEDSNIKVYSHARGCMIYLHRDAVDKVGGWFEGFGPYGHEHDDLSSRIYNSGLIPHRFMDVKNSDELWYSLDEWEPVKHKSTLPDRIRRKSVRDFADLHGQRKWTCTNYEPFQPRDNEIVTCYFTSQRDPQRQYRRWPADISKIQSLVNSVGTNTLVVLHDCWPEDMTLPDHSNVRFVKVESSHQPYFQRWISYYEYITTNEDRLGYVWFVDATDVELLRNPWSINTHYLYVGEEPGTIGDNMWIQNNHTAPILQNFYQEHRDKPVVNAGIVGGYVDRLKPFIRNINDLYHALRVDRHYKKHPGPGLTDMGIFNYVAHAKFEDILNHGSHITTVFKGYSDNGTAIWKHK